MNENNIGNLSLKDVLRTVPVSWMDGYNTEISVKESCITITRAPYTYTFEGDGIICIQKDGSNPRRYDDHGYAYHGEKCVLQLMQENYERDEYRHELLIRYKELRESLHESAERLYNFGGITHEELQKIKETFNLKWIADNVHNKMGEV